MQDRLDKFRAEMDPLVYYLQHEVYPPGCSEHQKRTLRRQRQVHSIHNNKLYRKRQEHWVQVLTTPAEVRNVLLSYHAENGAHMGIVNTRTKISEKYFWYGMASDVTECVSACPTCRALEKGKIQTSSMKQLKASRSLQAVGMDLIGLQVPDEHSGSEFSHHSRNDAPIPVSPEHFLSEGNDQDEPTPVSPVPNQEQKPESYQLQHNNHLTIVLEALARDESFMDVTLTAQGRSLKAHKSVLSAVSPYFHGVLRDNPCQHPIIIMPRDVCYEELYSIVNYMYKGEMTVAAEDLTSLLKTAEILQISGLLPSDSSVTVNPQTESLPMGNVLSSSNSSSSVSSSSNIPPVSEASKTIKIPSQSPMTPPAWPKSTESMINPADFIDVDMACVKEEVVSEGEEDKDEPPSKKLCSQPAECSQLPEGIQQAAQCSQPSECSQQTGSEAQDDDDGSASIRLGLPSPDEQSIPSTSSHETGFRSLGVKSNPKKGFCSQGAKPSISPQPLQCPHCDEQYCDVKSIDSHLKIKHPTKPSFTCKCGRIFTRQIHHQAHTRMCSSSS